ADAHEIAGLRRRELRRCVGDRLPGAVPRLADREAAERVTVEAERRDLRDRALSQLGVDAALADAEDELAVGARRLPLAGRPDARAADRPPPLLPRRAGP